MTPYFHPRTTVREGALQSCRFFMLVPMPHYLSFPFAFYFSEYYVLRGFFTFLPDPTRGDILLHFLRIFIVIPLLSVYSDHSFSFPPQFIMNTFFSYFSRPLTTTVGRVAQSV